MVLSRLHIDPESTLGAPTAFTALLGGVIIPRTPIMMHARVLALSSSSSRYAWSVSTMPARGSANGNMYGAQVRAGTYETTSRPISAIQTGRLPKNGEEIALRCTNSVHDACSRACTLKFVRKSRYDASLTPTACTMRKHQVVSGCIQGERKT